MRLRITRRGTRDQEDARTKTMTTYGQTIQEAVVSLAARSPTQLHPAFTAHRPPKRKAIWIESPSTDANGRQLWRRQLPTRRPPTASLEASHVRASIA